MTYVQGFLTPVPVANRDAYVAHAMAASVMFAEFGAGRMVEAWGDDVPVGKRNDYHAAVQRDDGEAVLFSWIEYPNRATCDAAGERIMTDPRMATLGDCPFDTKRMMWAGFAVVVDEGRVKQGPGGAAGYVDGFVVPVSPARKDAYFDMARRAAQVFLDHGATRVVEAWGDDVPHGGTTDFHRAAHTQEDETVVFSWVEWPDRAMRDTGMAAVMTDERMKMPPADMPFDGTRMIYGGFVPVLDERLGGA